MNNSPTELNILQDSKINNKKMQSKKSVSPVISTVLLIMIVIILAGIVLLWSRGFIKEQVLKFDKPIENVCSEVSIRTFVNEDNSFGFTNIGNVPIYAIDLKTNEGWSSTVNKIEKTVDVGNSAIIEGYSYDSGKEIKIIPVLVGKTKSGKVKEFSCPEGYGFVV